MSGRWSNKRPAGHGGGTARGSFRRQIILTFVFGGFLLVSLMVGAMVWAEKIYLRRDSAAHAHALAEALAVSSVSWVLANDVVGLQEVVNAFRVYPELRYAMVVAANGRVLAHTDAAQSGRFVADKASVALLQSAPESVTLADNAASIDVAVPVLFESKAVGWARLRLGREPITERLEAMQRDSVLFVSTATLLSLLAALVLSQRLSRRVSALAGVAGQVREGRREVRADIRGADEIAQLAQVFNSMLDNLADSEQRFRALFEQAAVGVAQVETRTGRFIRINQRFCDIVGYPLEEMLASNFHAITFPDDLQSTVDNIDALASGRLREFSMEKRYRRKDGTVVWVNLTASAMWKAGEAPNYHVSIVQDVTAKIQAQEALLRLNQDLERRVQQETQQNREKDHLLIQQSRLAAMGEMIHNIAHQWRQPLNALSIIISNIEDDYRYGELTAERLEAIVAKSHRLLQRMSTTVDDFRDFFRPDKAPCDFDLGRAVEEAVFIVGDSLKNNAIALDLRLEPGLVAHGYPNQFAQAVLNLLVNAKDAFRERKIAVGRIELHLHAQAGLAVLDIADNAGGIPEAVLPKIFDPYFTTKDQGSGIGLYMTKMIVEGNMKGGIVATSQGNGSLFTLKIPLAAKAAP